MTTRNRSDRAYDRAHGGARRHGVRGRLPRHREIWVHVILTALWSSGVAWLILRYGFRSSGPFGALPHPLEPWALRAHALAAFATIWLLGQLWIVHVLPSWRSQRRVSGIVLGCTLIVLIASGYLLYYVGDEDARANIALVHWLLGICLVLPWLAHALRHYSIRKSSRSLP